MHDVLASWEYVDLTSSMKKQISDDLPNQVDESEYQRKKSMRSAYQEIQFPYGEEEIIFSQQEIDVGDVDFVAMIEDTEKLLRHEFSMNLPDKEGIGKYKFGSYFDDKKEVWCIFCRFFIIFQSCIQNQVKHLRQSFLLKQLTAESRELFLRKGFILDV